MLTGIQQITTQLSLILITVIAILIFNAKLFLAFISDLVAADRVGISISLRSD